LAGTPRQIHGPDSRFLKPGNEERSSVYGLDGSSPAFRGDIGDFDPLPLWESLEVPTVFVYGRRDTNVDVFKSAAIIENTLSKTALPYSLLLFRNNGHALYRDDVIEFLAEWLRDGGAS